MDGVVEHVVAYIFVVACALQDLPGRPNASACASFCFKAVPQQNEKQCADSNGSNGGIVIVIVVTVIVVGEAGAAEHCLAAMVRHNGNHL